MADVSYIKENPDYIDDLKKIISYEENNKNPDHVFIADEPYDSKWEYGDVGVHPTRIHQLEIHGFVDKVFNSNSTKAYSLIDRDDIKDTVESLLSQTDEDGMIRNMHEFPKNEDQLPDKLFGNIVGYDDVKWLIKRGITTDDITNFILIGEKGTGKSVFLTEMYKRMENSRYVVASESTSAGVLETLFEELPMYFLVDEFDDMKKNHQAVFSSYAETGILSETKSGKNRQVKTNIKTIAAANDRSKIKDNIFDRFTPIEFERYTHDEFKEVCEGVLTREEGKSYDEAYAIADCVWDHKGYGDVRMAIQVARLSDGDPQKVLKVIAE